MRNHSFSSLSTAFEHDVDHDDSYDLNLSVSSLAKLNRRKPQISTILKLNLIVVLVISLFIKLTIVSVINGSLSAFIGLKLLTHGLILYTFLKKHYIFLQLLFVLDVVLFVIFLLFEFLLLVSNFAIIIIQHKRNKNLGYIGIWLMILIAAIDLLILVMVAIVLENYRRPKERLQQLEAKFVTVVHNGRILASQMCKSGSYLLGFVCNGSTNQTPSNPTNNNGMQNNGTPRIYRDSENPNHRISCINTQEASSFSLNDDDYVHYSSVEMSNELANRFHSFSDFYNFNNRNANQRSNDANVAIVSATTIPCSTTNTINTITTSFNTNSSNVETTNASTTILSNISSSLQPNLQTNGPTTANATINESVSTNNTLTSILSSTLTNNLNNLNNFNNLNNLTNSVTATGYPSLTTLATSTLGTLDTATQSNHSNSLSIALSEEQNKSLIERTNLFKAMNRNSSFNNPTTSSIMNSDINSRSNSLSNTSSASKNTITNTITNKITSLTKNTNSDQIKNNLIDKSSSTQEDEKIYVHIYQSNVDEDGDPMDGPLRCTTVISNNTDDGSNSTMNTIVQMNRNAAERLNVNCNPVFI